HRPLALGPFGFHTYVGCPWSRLIADRAGAPGLDFETRETAIPVQRIHTFRAHAFAGPPRPASNPLPYPRRSCRPAPPPHKYQSRFQAAATVPAVPAAPRAMARAPQSAPARPCDTHRSRDASDIR